MTELWADTETFSPVQLRRGLAPYMEKAELMVFSWAFDDDKPECVDLTAGQPIPRRVIEEGFRDPSVTLKAHKADFDRSILGQHFPELRSPTRWHCTLAQAYSHSLPGALGLLCPILQVPEESAKQKGKDLISLFCKPTRNGGRNTRETHPAEWQEFLEYATQDIPAMRECSRRMPSWNYPDNPDELELWYLDQEINEYGVLIDVDFARAAVEAIAREKKRIASATSEATGGQVANATQRDRLLEYILAEHGVSLPDMQGSTLERRLEDENLPDAVRLLIALRLAASTTSVAKYGRALDAIGADGRLRWLLQFCGAMRTGRFAGRLFQPQNMPRPKHKLPQIERAIAAAKADVLDLVFDDVLPVLSSSLRGLVIAPPGCKLVVADLSNIEGRFTAWEAGEEWKLQAFRDYDTFKLDERGQRIPDPKKKGEFLRVGPDLYRLAYSRSFSMPVGDVTDDQRQIGKVQELALGFQGAVGAFSAMAAAYGMESLATEQEVADAVESARTLGKKSPLYGTVLWPADLDFPEGDYIPGEEHFWQAIHEAKVLRIVRAWRKAHPAIVNYWYALERAAKHTTATGEPRTVGAGAAAVEFDKVGTWLRCRLPSGRYLSYPAAHVIHDKLTYMGVNPYSRQWQRLKTYGGKLCENITQANARDVFARRFKHAKAAGYRIVLHSHDELITEAPDRPEFNAAHLAGILAAPTSWTPGLPLSAAGFEAYRYRKG
jgi:DNA polymerase bacteriophage-type